MQNLDSHVAGAPRERRIALIRHGQTDWNARNLFQGRIDRCLNVQGGRQADSIAAYLAEWRWDGVASSPLTRARETATILSERLDLAEALTNPDLIEQSFGDAEGVDRDVALAAWPDRAFPNAEARSVVDARARAAWSAIEESGKNMLVVTHVIIIESIVEALTGKRPGPAGNCSATILEKRGLDWVVVSVREPSLATG